MARREKQKPSYEPAPVVPREMLLRFQTIQEVMSGQLEVAEGARRLGMSRNHFQTLLHRAEKAVLESVTPKPAGRPARPAREVELEAELLRVQRENQALQLRSEAVEILTEPVAGNSATWGKLARAMPTILVLERPARIWTQWLSISLMEMSPSGSSLM